MMDVYIVFLSLIAFTSLLMGIKVFFKAPAHSVNMAFLGKSIVLTVFTLLALGLQYSRSLAGALLWHKYYMLFMLILPLSFIAFYSLVIGLNKRERFLAILILGYFMFILGVWFFLEPRGFCDYSQIHGFWVVCGKAEWFNLIIFAIYIIVIPVAFFALLWRWNRSCKTRKEVYHSRIILFSLLLTYLLSFSMDFIVMRFISIPHMTPLFFMFYLVSVYYALTRYYFLDNELNNHLDEILDNVNDLVFFLDGQLNIKKVNSAVLKAFDRDESFFIDKGFSSLLLRVSVQEKLNTLISGEIKSFSENLTLHTEAVDYTVKAAFSEVIDKFGDPLGILVAASATMKPDKFRKLYGITKREMDVLISALNGLSSQKMAEELNITRRTVETHLSSLYAKMEVKNKMEMCNAANRLGIINL